MFKITLETTDLEMPEFQEYLKANGIEAVKIAEPAHVLGAGEIIEYSADNSEALEGLVMEWFDCGDAEVLMEQINSIKRVK